MLLRPRTRLTRGLLTVALIAGLTTGPLSNPASAVAVLAEPANELPDVDLRKGVLESTAAQRALVRSMGARASWNRFGTPRSLFAYDGFLGTASGSNAVAAARRWVTEHRALFKLSRSEVAELELVNNARITDSPARAVLFRQRFDGLPATHDGRLTVGVTRGKIAYVSSSIAPSDHSVPSARLADEDAVVAAVAEAGFPRSATDITGAGREHDWKTYRVAGISEPVRTRLVALPTPRDGANAAYEVVLVDLSGPVDLGYRSFVDAVSGRVLVRQSIVDQLADNPRWRFFNAYPEVDYSSQDTRRTVCWFIDRDFDCVRGVENEAARLPWDVDPDTGRTTFTTRGNAARTAASSLSPFTPSENYSPISPDREYIYPFNNYWYKSKCFRDEIGTQESDLDAAIVNLFTAHNRIHDWQYYLGFTEENYNLQQSNFDKEGRPGDPEVGNAQAASITGGAPTYTGRDNANQITPNDGISPVTNMYLWQPIAGAFYPPCVDGDFDMSVILHEYTHATSNRMVAGPDAGLDSRQGGSMGESWSDLVAAEFLTAHGLTPVGGENPVSVGAYVTGNPQRGIRNYGMNRSPLNFSDVGYDITGAQVHADGEIWSATNFDIRKALMKKFNSRFPASDQRLQDRCNRGELPANQCPGNRRWMQLTFDAWLLMEADVTMVDARDALLAADKMRFQGANSKTLWKVFAKRGLGSKAAFVEYALPNDRVAPSFDSPKARNEAQVRFRMVDRKGKSVRAKVFVGRYEARVTPVADTNPKTKRTATHRFVPGRYQLLIKGRRFGMTRISKRFRAGQRSVVRVRLQRNWASRFNGATAVGEGVNPEALIDDSEATNWAVIGRQPTVEGATVTVDLAGGTHRVDLVKVSAMLRPRDRLGPTEDPNDPGQNRFSALRQFKIQVCKATKANGMCLTDQGYRTIFTSSPKAFPARRPRPVAPDLVLRTFNVPNARATHVRLVVVHNQCTGQQSYHGEEDEDPLNPTDCRDGSAQDNNVRAAELQVFSGRSGTR